MAEVILPDPPFDPAVAYAREMGERHARAGAGFTNPYPAGSLQGRAWREAYDSTPKGVPQMSGPRGRGEEELAAGVEARAEGYEKSKHLLENTDANPQPGFLLPPPMQFVTGPSVEQVALAVLGHLFDADLWDKDSAIAVQAAEGLVNKSFLVAEAFIAELERRRKKRLDDLSALG